MPPIALPVNRAAFVESRHTIEFHANGSPKVIDRKEPSSALALVSWPMQAYKAFMAATGELIKLRIDYNSDSVELAQGEGATVKAMNRLADELKSLTGGKQTQERVGPATPLLSIVMGKRSADDAGGLLPEPQRGAEACAGSAAVPTPAPGPGQAGSPAPCTAGQACPGTGAPAGARP